MGWRATDMPVLPTGVNSLEGMRNPVDGNLGARLRDHVHDVVGVRRGRQERVLDAVLLGRAIASPMTPNAARSR